FLLSLTTPPTSTLFPYTTLFRSPPPRGRRSPRRAAWAQAMPLMLARSDRMFDRMRLPPKTAVPATRMSAPAATASGAVLGSIPRSEEHTSELQSRENLVCRLLLE